MMKLLAEELVAYWRASPSWAKVSWILSTVLASSSLASLSETVFLWKGFIKDGIEFYRHILNPISNQLNSFFHANLTASEIDLLVIFGLFAASYLRFTVAKQIEARPNLPKTIMLYVRAFIFSFILWGGLVLFIAAGILGRLNMFFDLFAVVLFMMVLFYPFQAKRYYDFPDVREDCFTGEILKIATLRQYTSKMPVFLFVYYGPLVFAVLIVCIVAAINAGLNK